MRRGPLLALSLVHSLLLILLLNPPVAEAHPFHLQVANDNAVNPEAVGKGRWLGQSFIPTTDFIITRVSLYVRDVGGTNVLAVSVREDGGGYPAAVNLTAGSTDAGSMETWVDFDLDPRVGLMANRTYWIVAYSDKGGGAGYEWWNSSSDAVYPNGTGVESPDGLAWVGLGSDLAFRVYGYLRPSLSFSVDVSADVLGPADVAVFRVNLTNAGPGEAGTLWVDVTLPVELGYISDDASLIGGVLSGRYSFEFQTVGPGAYSFNLTVSVGGGVANGTVALTRFVFNATDHLGTAIASFSRDVAVMVENADLAVSLVQSSATVDPAEEITLNATVTNVGLRTAQNLLVRGGVSPNTTYVSSWPSGAYDAATGHVTWTPPPLTSGERMSVEWTVRVTLGSTDGASVISTAHVEYTDTTGGPMPLDDAVAVATVNAPYFAPVLVLDRPSAENGDEVLATLHYNNTGSDVASSFWANWSLGGHYELLDVSPTVATVGSGEGFDVAVASVDPGVHSLVARLRVIRGLADGLRMDLQVAWDAADQNGNPLQSETLDSAVDLHAPSVFLALNVSTPNVDVGSVFSLDLVIRNDGRAPALGWLNLTLPRGASYVGDNGTFPVVATVDRVTWTLPPIAEGSVVPLEVRLRMDGEPGIRSLHFVLNLTDESGARPQAVLSNVASIESVQAAGVWWLSAIVAAAIAAALALLLIRRRSGDLSIEEVFIVHRSGKLLAHRSKTLTPEKDEDVVAAMFDSVQAFAREAFSRHGDATMRGLQFEEWSILIERGGHHYVAVVYMGQDDGSLERRVSLVSERIEEEFGETLRTWNGDMAEVRGIRDLIPSLLGNARDRRVRRGREGGATHSD